jgi:hypothetical protein
MDCRAMSSKKVTENQKEKVLSLFKQGNSPKEIAEKISRISFKRVLDYLYIHAGEGNIRRSDIWFSINHTIRETIEKYKSEEKEVQKNKLFDECVVLLHIHPDDFRLYIKLRNARVAHGDLYELISDIELLLHRAIKNLLIKEYGKKEWWRKGVPKSVRTKCAASYEEDDDDPAKEAYCYTNLIDIKTIFEKRWKEFEKYLPKKILGDSKSFLSNLVKINHIRNRVMHPIKGHDFTPKDFDSVHEFHASIKKEKWQDKDIVL